MNMAFARIQWPERVLAGDVVKVRLLVRHPMDTGYLQDLLGKLVPRNVIQQRRADRANQIRHRRSLRCESTPGRRSVVCIR